MVGGFHWLWRLVLFHAKLTGVTRFLFYFIVLKHRRTKTQMQKLLSYIWHLVLFSWQRYIRNVVARFCKKDFKNWNFFWQHCL